jgi:hypothetical protein
LQSGTVVKKLPHAKFAKMRLRQDALFAMFGERKTFSIHQILAVWDEKRIFQPQAISPAMR